MVAELPRGALGAAALLLVLCGSSRVAALAAPRGLVRALATAVLAAGTLVVHSLTLGLVGWGTSPVALAGAAVASWGAVQALTPPPPEALLTEAARWWGRLGRAEQAAAGAGLGALLGWLVWLWRWPFVGYDGMLQNLLEITIWVHNGRPGSQHRVFGMAPIEAFPMTNDVLVSWGAAFARSFAVVAPWAMLVVLLFVLSLVSLLASLGVPRVVGALAIASVVTIPHVVGLTNTPKSDLPALAWLTCCAALTVNSRTHPRLMGIAVVAAGLSVGSKPTTAPLAGLIVLGGLWVHRDRLRRHLPAVAVGAVGALAVGGVWYVRNLIDHGSPVWPLGTTPWGDPLPPLFVEAGDTFLDAPWATVRGQGRRLVGVAAGCLVLAPLGIVVGLVDRQRVSRLLAAAGLIALALWVVTPVTGLSNEPLASDVVTSTTRYLLPAATLGALTLAVSGRRSQLRWPVAGVLAAVTVGNLVAVAVYVGHGRLMPGVGYVLGGAATMALLTVALAAVAERSRPANTGAGARGRTAAVAGSALAVAAVTAGVLVSADGWTGRHRQILHFGGEPIDVLLSHPRYLSGAEPIAVTNIAWSDLVGDRLDHEVRLLADGISCDALDAILAHHWLVLIDRDFVGPPDLPLERGRLQGETPVAADEVIRVYEPTG